MRCKRLEKAEARNMFSPQKCKNKTSGLQTANFRKCLFLIVLVMVLDCACRKSNTSENVSSSHSSPVSTAGLSQSNAPVLVGHPVKLSDLSESEIHFGIAPKRGPGVTYQDDIILMEHGDKAIQSFASDGLSWALDANAPQVNEIQEGKILFATDRCVGKVLAVRRNGNSVSVVLGPVQLTELIKEGTFAYDQPLDLSNAIAVVAPDYPAAVGSKALQQEIAQPSTTSSNGAVHSFRRSVSYYTVSKQGKWTPMRTVTAGTPALVNAVYHPDFSSLTPVAFQAQAPSLGGQASPIPVPAPQLQQLEFNDLQATPCSIDCGGIGAKIYQEKDGVKVSISVVFHLNHPRFVFGAHVYGSGIEAHMQLFGGAGVTATIDAATGANFSSIQANIKELGLVPAEINIPLGGLVPLTAKLSQALDITSGFSAKNSVLHGEGSLDLDGEISASYSTSNGWDIAKPSATVKNNLAGLISGASMGINSFVFAFSQRLMVGVGTLGFAAGPYVDLLTTLTVLKQSSATWADCRQATFAMSLGAGIGYSMPKIVANVINAVLKFFGAKPIPSWGSIVALPKRVDLMNRLDMVPGNCAGGK
jgi:hypothetical protein